MPIQMIVISRGPWTHNPHRMFEVRRNDRHPIKGRRWFEVNEDEVQDLIDALRAAQRSSLPSDPFHNTVIYSTVGEGQENG